MKILSSLFIFVLFTSSAFGAGRRELLSAHRALHQGQYATCISICNEVLKSPDVEKLGALNIGLLHNNLGLSELFLGNTTAAVSDLNDAVERLPQTASLYVNRGYALACSGRKDEALRDYLSALELSPATALRGPSSQQALEKVDPFFNPQAFEDFALAVRLNSPLYAHALSLAGLILQNQHEPLDAVELYEAARDYNPKDTENLLRLATAYLQLGKENFALQIFSDILKLKNPPPETLVFALNQLGMVEFRENNFDKALAYLNQAAEHKELQDITCYNLGLAQLNTGAYNKAIENFSQALELVKNEDFLPSLYLNRGNAWFYLGDFENARLDYFDYNQKKPADNFGAILFYLASARAERTDAKDSLLYNRKQRDQSQWVTAVTALYLNELSVEQLLAIASKNDDPKLKNEQLCEGYFYVAQYYLLQKDKQKAKHYFELCVQTKVFAFIEYHGALAELARD